jgi:hypothetical protein
VTAVTTGISWLTPTQQTYVKNNIKEIKVISGSTVPHVDTNNVLTVENNAASAADIAAALEVWLGVL